MDLSLSEIQQQLSDSVGSFLSRLPRMDMPAEPQTGTDAVWQALAEDLGLLSLMLAEEQGGFGGRGEDLLVVMQAMGEHLLAQPFMEAAIATTCLLKGCESDEATTLLEKAVAGQSLVVPLLDTNAVAYALGDMWNVSGDMGLVYPAPAAEVFLVAASDINSGQMVLLKVDSKDAAIRPVATTDQKWAGHIQLSNTPATFVLGGASAKEAIELTEDMSLAALCAEASGVLLKLLDDTVAFTKDRRQFGQSISRFQVLQHRMSDMLIQCEMAKSAAMLACLSLDKPAPERRKAVSAAKITISEACRFVGQNAVQLHGGLGMSAETEMTRWFKRATVIEYQLGSRDYHVERYGNLA